MGQYSTGKTLFNVVPEAIDYIVQVIEKTLCHVVQEAPDNIVPEKIMFNNVAILLGQLCVGKNLYNVAQETPDNISQEKIQFNIVWITSFFDDFYFEPVNFLITTGCCKCSANIAQISPKLHKKNRGPTLNKRTIFYRTKMVFNNNNNNNSFIYSW